MKYNQKKLHWVKDRNFKMTSLVIWNDNYLPFSCVIFRKDNQDTVEVRMYTTVEGMIYKEDFIIDERRTNTEEEIVYRLTNWAQKVINVYTILDKDEERLLHKNDAVMACRNEMFLVNIISLKNNDIAEMNLRAPDYGFYSMALNFDEYVNEMETNDNSVLTINFLVLADKHNK